MLPSGDQSGWRSQSGFVVSRLTPVPSAFMLKMSKLRVCGSVRRLANAIRPLKGAADAGAARHSQAAPAPNSSARVLRIGPAAIAA